MHSGAGRELDEEEAARGAAEAEAPAAEEVADAEP